MPSEAAVFNTSREKSGLLLRPSNSRYQAA
jgi:hypothetical protein